MNTSNQTKPKMSLHARRNIRDEYDKKIADTLDRAQRYVDEADLKFDPNFEENYAILLALESTLDRAEPDDNIKLHKLWQETFGLNTREYFEAFVDRLQLEKFREDDALRKVFRTTISSKVVALRIVKDQEMEEPCDVAVEDGTLVIRVNLHHFAYSPYHAPRNLKEVLSTESGEGNCE